MLDATQDRCGPVEFAGAAEKVEHFAMQCLEHPGRRPRARVAPVLVCQP
ncbi:hypothetical protein GFS60_07454 (plasmid) [Rhodococcus sp. WAY2]|nr:hypothetical protein GFS60_07454 [Rhodococcus sp. WAY2]